jgi:hypothetical protein
MSQFLLAESRSDTGNNKHNSEINAYNSVKTAEHVALWSFLCLPAYPDACLFLGLLAAIGRFAQVQDWCAKALANWAQTP